jgi:hypothetical protein
MVFRVRLFDKFFSGTVERRREQFLKVYGYAHNDKTKVDKAIVALLDKAKREDEDEVRIPIDLVIALTLREGFARKQGRAWRGDTDERRLDTAIADVRRRRQRGATLDTAIEAAAADNRVSVSVLRDELRNPARRARRRARREQGGSS